MTIAATRIASVDPEDPVVPEVVPPPDGDSGEVVVLLAEDGARSAGWASRLAVRLAGDWADRGTRVTLVDADFTEASLHEVLGARNGEGAADLVLYGASPRRVARRVEGHGFLFVPSGTVVADPSEVYRHSRWDRIAGAFRESETVLLLYLPAEPRGVEELAATADRVVRLSAFRPDREPDPSVTVIHPDGVVADAPAESETEPDTMESEPATPAVHTSAGSGIEVVTEEEAVLAGDPEPSAAPGSMETEAAGRSPSGRWDDPTENPSEASVLMGPTRPASARSSHVFPWVLLLLMVTLGAVLVAAWFGVISIPGLTPATPGG